MSSSTHAQCKCLHDTILHKPCCTLLVSAHTLRSNSGCMRVYGLICYTSEDEDALVVSVRAHVRRGYVVLGTVPFFNLFTTSPTFF